MNIIVMSSLAWDFLWQRPQHVASELAKKGNNVVYVNLPIYMPPTSFIKKLRKNELVEIRKTEENIWVVQLYLPEFRGTLSRIKDQFMRSSFKSSLKTIDFRPDASIIYSLHFVPLIKTLNSINSKVTYDCVDDALSFEEFMGPKFARQEIELIKASSICFATSQMLVEKITKYNSNCTYLPNAMDFEHFNAVAEPGDVAVNSEVASLRHPVIGFVGAVYDWIDVDLICELAKKQQGYSILLVGPVDYSKDKLAAYSNITMVGTKPYKTLPSYLASMNVCMIPFKLNDITLASNPIKMYEYLATGKPVVSTALPEIIRNASNVVYIGQDHEDFIRKVESAVKESEVNGETASSERIEFARKNSWETRVEVINQRLKEILAC